MVETEDRSSTGVGVPERRRAYVPARKLDTPYPLIDSDPHFNRVIRYARPSDYAEAGAIAAIGPGIMAVLNKSHPVLAGRGWTSLGIRLGAAMGLYAGFLGLYINSSHRFLGISENGREIERDMREMVDKVKKGEPLYGTSSMSEHHQAVAHRNSRYTTFTLFLFPMFNFVNHNHHGVDTAKYYRQAERELAAEGR